MQKENKNLMIEKKSNQQRNQTKKLLQQKIFRSVLKEEYLINLIK